MAENLNAGYRANSWDAPGIGPVTEHATIGASIVIKGEVSGNEALFIDGTVEGSVNCPEHRVTIGRSSNVKADIRARDVVVMGSVKGNIQCTDLLDVRGESNIQGEIVTRRIRIDDGAVLRGSVEIQKNDKLVQAYEAPKLEAPKSEPAVSTQVPTEPAGAEAAKAEPSKAEVMAAAVARRVRSSVLFKPVR
ncbi:MAG TPA: polymer-forming cytoskeletal protein [Terriglobales bacterium]|nr:polymer-forming cytoskeletal protein [Terriglobales bacterium]